MAKLACYSSYLLTFYFCIPVPYDEKDIHFPVFVLEGLVGLHRTIQFQLLSHYWLGHRLGLLWYWMVCLGNEQRSFCHFWDCTQVLPFWVSLTLDVGSLFTAAPAKHNRCSLPQTRGSSSQPLPLTSRVGKLLSAALLRHGGHSDHGPSQPLHWERGSKGRQTETTITDN